MAHDTILTSPKNDQPTIHPYQALDNLVHSLQECTQDIQDATTRLRALQEGQQDILRRALFEAKDNAELRALAQYLYFDAPTEIHRSIIKHVLGFMVKGTVQSWLCEDYAVEATCYDCKEPFMYEVNSFTDLQEFRRNYGGFRNKPRQDRCPSCIYAIQHGRSKAWEQYKEEQEQKLIHLRSMPYREYLKTEHWQGIRSRALRRAQFRCQLCNISAPLHVHHRSYVYRGEEQYHMDDVIALCRGCHAKHHDIDEN